MFSPEWCIIHKTQSHFRRERGGEGRGGARKEEREELGREGREEGIHTLFSPRWRIVHKTKSHFSLLISK